ncbi:hypothetical protein E5288_WYG014244 [Bos mutus]|uniref:Uncharacterized protein n=1 Tax=Bos mutus TaxID=72004 RepID=A0A6B0R709_9CETA|nr:hypothetical protein [Bos mutus]
MEQQTEARERRQLKAKEKLEQRVMKRPMKSRRIRKYSSVVEDIPHQIGLKRMPVVLTLVFPSVEECQVRKPRIHDELRFISFTECLYSGV